jgi:hypothetical protein
MPLDEILASSGALIGLAFVIYALATLAVTIWAIVDAASRPAGAFTAAGSNKALWITIIVIGWLVTGLIGLVLACVYLASIRPRVRAITG